MYLLHPPGEIILNTAASVTDEQGELPVQQSIHQDHLDVSKLGDMHGLLVSDTFSMSIFYIDSTISCAVWWLLTSSFPPWLHCNKSAICFGSESSLCGSFATSSQFAGFLSVWLSGVSAPVMHHPFCSHQEATSTVRHHSICPPNTLHSLFMTGPAPVCLVWLFFARSKAFEHINLLVLISSGLIWLVSAVCWRLIFSRCVLYNGTMLAVMSQSIQVIICISSAGLK